MKNSKIILMLALGLNCAAIQTTDNSNFTDKMKELTKKLQRSAYRTADWLEYYCHAMTHNLSDWVEYCRNSAQDNAAAFTSFIQDETSDAYKKLNRTQQKAIRELNKFYRDMASATREKQDELVAGFSKKWAQCQRAFRKTANKTHEQAEILNEKMKSFTDKLENSAHETKDLLDYHAHAVAYDLSDWVEYNRNLALNNGTAMFENLLQDEQSNEFKQLSADKQQAIKDLNDFYEDMAYASEEEQEKLVRDFSHRWNQCKHFFKNNN
jgi:ElaB/YqjD/DUF883 family membrane-anchored ribosome-binding protein